METPGPDSFEAREGDFDASLMLPASGEQLMPNSPLFREAILANMLHFRLGRLGFGGGETPQVGRPDHTE